MKRFFFIATLLTIFSVAANAQRVYTKNGLISFFSSTKMEDIKADNNQVLCVLNTQTGELQFSVLNKGFHFPKALMEEHFNENYIESNKFPKSTFKGTVAEISKVNFTQDGTYPVSVKGDLVIHGVTKNITAPGSIVIKDGKVATSSKFIVKLADYNISIPGAVKSNISETIEITVKCNLDQKM
ncbi:YceI family protein [Ferruginibacter profundus]